MLTERGKRHALGPGELQSLNRLPKSHSSDTLSVLLLCQKKCPDFFQVTVAVRNLEMSSPGKMLYRENVLVLSSEWVSPCIDCIWGWFDIVSIFSTCFIFEVWLSLALFLTSRSKVPMSPSWQPVLLSFFTRGFCSADGTEGMGRDSCVCPKSLQLAAVHLHNWRLCSALVI